TRTVSFWLSPIGFLGHFGRKSSEMLGFRRKMRKRHAETTESSGKSRLKGVVPEPGTPYFGACVAAFVVTLLLPLLAMLDVSRRLAGRRLRRLRALAAAPPVVEPSTPAHAVHRVINRRAAADALAGAGSRKPFRTP